jgi:hypothetical protein
MSLESGRISSAGESATHVPTQARAASSVGRIGRVGLSRVWSALQARKLLPSRWPEQGAPRSVVDSRDRLREPVGRLDGGGENEGRHQSRRSIEHNALALQGCKKAHSARIGEAQRRKIKNHVLPRVYARECRSKLIQPGPVQLTFEHEGDVVFKFKSGDS